VLQRLSNRRVEGDGFTVECLGNSPSEYREGDKTAVFLIEAEISPPDQVHWRIYAGTVRSWEPPHQLEPLSAGDRQRILAHISAALLLLDMPHTIDDQ
jgi:hypothetical protein